MSNMKIRLSTLWLFATLNYIYCDVVTVMDPAHHSPIALTQGFLLGASVLVEIPIAMVLMARVLPYSANRWANVIAGGLMVLVQVASLFVSVPAFYYVFFSVIEIATTALVVWFAWRWVNEAPARVRGTQTKAATPGLASRASS